MENDLFGLEFDSTNPLIPIIARVVAGGQADKWNSRAEESRRGPCLFLFNGVQADVTSYKQ